MSQDTQTIFRAVKNKDNPYAMIDKRIVEDKNLTWKAKGLLVYILSRPDNWIIQMQDLVNQSQDGINAIRAAMKELKAAGYIKYKGRRKDATGKITGAIWEVHERPCNDFPPMDFPHVDSPQMENLPLNNKELTNTELNNKSAAELPPLRVLPQAPTKAGTTTWPPDIRDLARAFAECKGRDPYQHEKGYWIKSLRKKYVPLGITVQELEQMYRQAIRDKVTIHSPDSILYTMDKVRKPEREAPIVLGTMEDGALQVKHANGIISLVYGN